MFSRLFLTFVFGEQKLPVNWSVLKNGVSFNNTTFIVWLDGTVIWAVVSINESFQALY